MIVGQNCILSVNGNIRAVGTVNGRLDNVNSDGELTSVLAIKHHKKPKLLVGIKTVNEDYLLVDPTSQFQIVDNGKLRYVDADLVKPGYIICPPMPDYAELAMWTNLYGVKVESKELRFTNASTIIFDKCDYVRISNVPILHDNYCNRKLRYIAKRSTSVANLLLK